MGWFDVPNGLRSHLLADTALGNLLADRVHYQMLPGNSQYPHVWFARTGRRQDELLSGEEEMTIETYSFEVVGIDNCDAVVERLVELLESFGGQVGARDVQAVDIGDTDDNYIFKSVGEGDADYLYAIQVEIYSVEQTT
jgi:hypothetical protein